MKKLCIYPLHHLQKIILPLITLLYLVSTVFSISFAQSQTATLSLNKEQNTQPAEKIQLLLSELTSKSFNKKIATVTEMANIDHPQTIVILEALLHKQLFYTKKDKQVLIVKKSNQLLTAYHPLTNALQGEIHKSQVKRIRTNNKLRKTLKGLLARKKLSSGDEQSRFAAAQQILKNVKAQYRPILEKALATEKQQRIRDTLKLAIAFIDIHHHDQKTRLAAIELLGDSLHPAARGKLEQLLQKDAQGNYLESDKVVIQQAQQALKQINQKRSLFNKLETLFFGLSLGSVLLLVSIGLAITFGVMGVINMAHGELMMLGAYTTYLVQQLMPNHIDISLFVAIPCAFIVSATFGILIERGVIRHLYSRPLETLLATFGISLILQQLVRTAISAQNVAVQTPAWLSGSLEINPFFAITYNRLYIIIFALVIFALLILLLKKTTLGLQVRAVSQNREMARAMGIKTQWIDSLTFGLGSGVAGIAGVALSQLTNVGPNLGQGYIIDSFMVVVFGGVESLWGTLVASMTLGVANKFIEPWAGAVMAKILVLIFLILFIQKRPKGLFPQKGRSSVGS